MANRDRPNGFKPVRMLNGADVPVLDFPVDAGEASTLMVGDLVAAEADGKVNLAVANDGIAVLGAVNALSAKPLCWGGGILYPQAVSR